MTIITLAEKIAAVEQEIKQYQQLFPHSAPTPVDKHRAVLEAVLADLRAMLSCHWDHGECPLCRRAGAEEMRERLKTRIDTRLNDCLCEMKPDYDDSITGFNEAWDIVRAIFK